MNPDGTMTVSVGRGESGNTEGAEEKVIEEPRDGGDTWGTSAR